MNESENRPDAEVDAIMTRLQQRWPTSWSKRWCGGEEGACGCIGCVQIACRTFMAEYVLQHPLGPHDPEHIDESQIPAGVRARYRPTKSEWIARMARQPQLRSAP